MISFSKIFTCFKDIQMLPRLLAEEDQRARVSTHLWMQCYVSTHLWMQCYVLHIYGRNAMFYTFMDAMLSFICMYLFFSYVTLLKPEHFYLHVCCFS